MILHSDKTLNVYLDATCVFDLIFFGEGADKSTLHLERYETDYDFPTFSYIHLYGANTELTGCLAKVVVFDEVHEDITYSNVYDILAELKQEILESEDGTLPRETDEDIFFDGRYFITDDFSRNMNYWTMEYLRGLPYTYPEENRELSENVPYIYVEGTQIDRVYISKNFGAWQLPKQLLNNGITQNSDLWITSNDYIALGTKFGCEFLVEKYFRLGSFGEKEDLLLVECDNESCSVYNW